MNETIVNYLNKNFKYQIPATQIYENIDMWESWYKNKVDFHTYKDAYGKTRQMYSLGMAKRISEDWTSVIFTEKDEITTDKRQNKKFVEELIDDLRLRNKLTDIIEKSAWSGTCGAVIRLKNIKVDANGRIEATEKTEFDLVDVSAKNIIPLRIDHNKIVDVAFFSEITINKKKYFYLEVHRLTDEGYVINNIYLDVETGKEATLDGVIKELHTLSKTPLFAILKTPVVNNIDDNLGLGISIYGNAIDQLMDTDVKYHNSVMDFVLGGKKIIYNKKLIKYRTKRVKNSDGTYTTEEIPVYPDDISKQQFMQVGDELTDKEIIHEYNPELRTNENKEGLQFSLDLLSFKCNLGTKYYEFSDGAVVTATQYVGDRQDLMKNAKKYRDNLDTFIEDLIKAGLLIGRLILGKNVTEDCNIEVVNEDGILVSDEEIKEQYINEISQGLRSKTSYLMKFYGMTEEEALEELQLIQDEENGELFDEDIEEEENIDNVEQEMSDLEEELGAV